MPFEYRYPSTAANSRPNIPFRCGPTRFRAPSRQPYGRHCIYYKLSRLFRRRRSPLHPGGTAQRAKGQNHPKDPSHEPSPERRHIGDDRRYAVVFSGSCKGHFSSFHLSCRACQKTGGLFSDPGQPRQRSNLARLRFAVSRQGHRHGWRSPPVPCSHSCKAPAKISDIPPRPVVDDEPARVGHRQLQEIAVRQHKFPVHFQTLGIAVRLGPADVIPKSGQVRASMTPPFSPDRPDPGCLVRPTGPASCPPRRHGRWPGPALR